MGRIRFIACALVWAVVFVPTANAANARDGGPAPGFPASDDVAVRYQPDPYDVYVNDYVSEELPNDYTIAEAVPLRAVAPFTVTVVPGGPNPVCSMSSGSTNLSEGPWSFRVDPGSRRPEITVKECNGNVLTIHVNTEMPFTIDTKIINPTRGNTRIDVENNTDSPATVTVTNRAGKVVETAQLPAEDVGQITIPTRGIRSTMVFNVRVVGVEGLEVVRPVVAARGWATYYTGRDMWSDPVFSPCGVVYWWHDPKGMPKGASAASVQRDIAGSAKRLERYTSLRFVRAGSREQANLIYDWEKQGRNGPSAVGGVAGGKGSVSFNSQDDWPKDSYEGFERSRYGHGERGWLVIHETMHALGFEHVNDRESVMYPVNHGQVRFTSDDVDGLRSVYPNQCAA